jgi:hypothetical protein
MILEYAQLLSTAHRVLDGNEYIDASSGRRIKRWRLGNESMENMLYKASHINHPSAIWVRQSNNNYNWLMCLFQSLLTEYTHRYGRTHAVVNRCWQELRNPPKNLKGKTGFREPPQAMPIEYKVVGDSISAYQKYYIGGKAKLAKWTNRATPDWWLLNTVPTKEVQNAIL